MDESEEYIDMCKAIQDMREEAMQTGKKEGRQEGQQIKEKEIIKIGRASCRERV